MKIETRLVGDYIKVDISTDGADLEMGFLDVNEAKNLRESLLSTIDELSYFIEREAKR